MNLKPKFDVKRSAMQQCDEKSTAKTFTEKRKDPEKDRLRKASNAELYHYLRNVITFAFRKGDRAQFMIAYLQDDLYRKKRLNYVLRRFRISRAVLQSLLGRMPVSQTSLFLSFLFPC